jgi:hypothetical protein
MSKLISRLSLLGPRIRAGLAAALGRFPFMLLCGLAGTVAGIVMVEDHGTYDYVMSLCTKAGMTAALGMPLFFSLRMLRERRGGWFLELLGVPLLAGWYFWLPHNVKDGPGIIYIRWMLLEGALHFFAAVSAYVGGAAGNGFWQFNRRIFLRFCLATLYTGVLTLGLELALVSADKLFELNLDHSYPNLFFAMIGCFQPVFFLAGVPRDFAALEVDMEYPRGLKAFTQFVLAPLVAAYTAILYAYGFKIVAAHSWPHGWVAMPVLILSGVGILAALLLHPLRERPEEKWGGWFCRNFPRALAPLSLLLLLSVWERVKHYGVTEERYLGIVAGGWILSWALVFVVKRRAGIRWVPASLAVICLLAAVGPWSAGAISEVSQLARLKQMLEAHGLLVSGQIQVQQKMMILPSTDYDELNSTIRYLVGTHGAESMHELFGGVLPNWKNLTRWTAGDEILKKIKVGGGASEQYPTDNYSLDQSKGVDVEGYKKVTYIPGLYFSGVNNRRKIGSLYFDIEDGELKVAADEKGAIQTVQMDGLLKGLPKAGRSDAPAELMTVDLEVNGLAYRIVFTELSVSKEEDKAPTIESCGFMLLEK